MLFKKSFAVLFSCLLLLSSFVGAASAAELHLYAGAGLKLPTDAIVQRFEAETGAKVTVEYAGMGQLLTRYTTTRVGDVFLSGSEFYVGELEKEGLVLSKHRLVYHTPVLVVRRDRAGGIATIEELAKSDLRLAMGDPQAIALGKGGEKLIEASGFGDALRAKVAVRGTTIKQVLLYVENGDVDAAIIGRSDAVKNPNFLILPTPAGTPEEISIAAALGTSANPELAKRLAAYFAAPESLKVFEAHGFLPLR